MCFCTGKNPEKMARIVSLLVLSFLPGCRESVSKGHFLQAKPFAKKCVLLCGLWPSPLEPWWTRTFLGPIQAYGVIISGLSLKFQLLHAFIHLLRACYLSGTVLGSEYAREQNGKKSLLACSLWLGEKHLIDTILKKNTVILLYLWGVDSRTPQIPKSMNVQVSYRKWYRICA